MIAAEDLSCIEADCPLCKSKGIYFYHNRIHVYFSCLLCRGVFVNRATLPDREAELSRYKEHNNDVNDPGYQNFVSPIVESVLRDYSTGHDGLDFGCGPGSVISKLLSDKGYRINQYDPYFSHSPHLLKRKYDYIVCCEVIEHFYNPYKEFALLRKILSVGSALYCMTDILTDKTDFGKWYYKNDKTHVFFYRHETLAWIGEQFGFRNISVNNRLITFCG
ncbi:Methyltransferase-related protein [Chitinispirillum alkaliphilum]|nr:Methyltransferase-related protein [Chitinispirillum alkaliphilum]